MTKKMTKIKLTTFTLVLIISGLFADENYGHFIIARLKYGGGGDWYCDASSLPNLLQFIDDNTDIKVNLKEKRTAPEDNDFFAFPYLYMTGHGNIRFTESEIDRLRKHLTNGGFLHVDDNYGLDQSFRREIKRIFPNQDLVELPFDHDIFHSYYDFPKGLPKIHEHDNKPPRGFGIFYEGRLVVFYTYECDLGDGWESPNVHNDPPEKRLAALKMGTNIIIYALTN